MQLEKVAQVWFSVSASTCVVSVIAYSKIIQKRKVKSKTNYSSQQSKLYLDKNAIAFISMFH